MNKSGVTQPLRLCFLMWLIFTIEYFMGMDFGDYGILPRTPEGLVGLVIGPLIHGNFQHLISNTIPLLVLGGALFIFFPSIANTVFFYSYFFTNALVWVFARSYYHIGASGLVYALAAFLVFYGFFQRNFKSVLVSLITITFYGGLGPSLFYFDARVSWESHLMGAIVGFSSAFLFSRR